jgi:hypothetical protein
LIKTILKSWLWNLYCVHKIHSKGKSCKIVLPGRKVYEARTLLGLGVFRCRTRVSVCLNTDMTLHWDLWLHWIILFSQTIIGVSTYQFMCSCRVQCLCLILHNPPWKPLKNWIKLQNKQDRKRSQTWKQY